MPAFVRTPHIPPMLVARFPAEQMTPLYTVVRTFNELIDEGGRVEGDGKSRGKNGVVKTSCAVECVIDELFYRDPVEYANASQEWLTNQSREDGIIGGLVKELRSQL